MNARIKTTQKQSAEKRLDLVFSEYIKVRDTRNGTIWPVCKCCGTPVKPSEGECGHVEKRANHATRWDEENAFFIHTFPCNREDRPFTWLDPELRDVLKVRANSLAKFFEYELEEMIVSYREKIKEIKTKYR